MPLLTYEQLPCGVVILDHEGIIIYANPFFSEWLQRKRHEVIGQHIEAFLSSTNKFLFHSYFYPELHTVGQIQEFVLHFERQDGVQIPAMMNAHRVTSSDEDEKVECILMPMTKRIEYEQEIRQMAKRLEAVNEEQAKAIEQLQQLQREIVQKQQELIMLTNTDKLTSIFNRRYIEERLAEHIAEAANHEDAFSVCIVDIDFFKKVNDMYGHQIGDYVLIEVARLMKECVAERGIVARYGGEEFVILLPRANRYEATHIAKSVNDCICTYLFEYVQRVTISIGVATYRVGDTESIMMNRADRALYYSKEHGRDRTTHFRDIEHVLHP